MKDMCECEHESHPSEEHDGDLSMHPYGAETDVQHLDMIGTVFGPYNICKDCQKDHPIPPDLLKP